MKKYLLTSCLSILLLVLSIGYWSQLNLAKDNILYTDYGKFYQSTRFLLEGKSIYSPIFFKKNTNKNLSSSHKAIQLPGNLNPPIFSLFILPIGLLSYDNSLIFWSLFSIICGIFSLLLIQKELQVAWKQSITTLGLLSAFFIYYPTFSSVEFGQVTLLLMPFVVGAWLAARRQYKVLVGVLLGIATSFKPFFALFFIYFLIRREWLSLFWFCFVIALSIFIPISLFGYHIFSDYWKILKLIQWSASSWNVSIYGFLLRTIGGLELNTPLIAAPSYLIKWLYFFISLSILSKLIQMLLPLSTIEADKKVDLDFSTVLIVMLLISPLGWLYYFPYFVIPVMVLLRFSFTFHHTKLMLLTILFIILSGLSTPLIASGFIQGKYVLMAFASSSCYLISLFILLNSLFMMRYLSVQVSLQKINSLNKKDLSITLLITLLSVSLIPSFVGILKVAHTLSLYGAGYTKEFNIVSQ